MLNDSVITYRTKTGGKVNFRKHPRYGSWTVDFNKGPIPSILSGSWTHLKELREKTEAYLASRRDPSRLYTEEEYEQWQETKAQ